jgi:uncharacterized protein (TIGR04222 family)
VNPLTWPGEKFIVAYLVLAIILVVVAYILWYRSGQDAKEPKVNDLTADPYLIAYLRGRVNETLRVAIFNLVDRGILVYDGSKLHVTRKGAPELRRALDQAIVKACKDGRKLDRLLADRGLRGVANEYLKPLGAAGLVSRGTDWTRRKAFGLGAAGLLAGVALAKILYAVSHGRGNFGFLFVAGCVAVIWVATVGLKRRTFRGGRMLASLQTLMARLKYDSGRVKPGGATNEALLLVSAYGLYALGNEQFAFVEQMFPRPKSGDSSSGGSGDSSCSSSCGGGGGCGGCGG